jgi:hypothetical protein
MNNREAKEAVAKVKEAEAKVKEVESKEIVDSFNQVFYRISLAVMFFAFVLSDLEEVNPWNRLLTHLNHLEETLFDLLR